MTDIVERKMIQEGFIACPDCGDNDDTRCPTCGGTGLVEVQPVAKKTPDAASGPGRLMPRDTEEGVIR